MALTDSLIAYWKLDEPSGTRADSHGSSHLADNNTVASATGKLNSGADFARSDGDYLNISDNASLSLGADTDHTLQVWIKPETDGIQSIIVHKNNDFVGALTAEYQLFSDDQNRLNYVVGNGSSAASLQTGSVLSAGVWTHILAWYSSADQKIYLQVNGGTTSEAVWTGGTQNTASPFVLSSQFGAGFAVDGIIDEVAFWKRVLTSDERTSLYNSGNGLSYEDLGGGGGGGSGVTHSDLAVYDLMGNPVAFSDTTLVYGRMPIYVVGLGLSVATLTAALSGGTIALNTDTTPPAVAIVDAPRGPLAYPNFRVRWIAIDSVSFPNFGEFDQESAGPADTPNPNAILYQFRLTGYSSWSNWVATTHIDYAAIPAGTYTFEVKAKDAAGNESTVASRTIVIT